MDKINYQLCQTIDLNFANTVTRIQTYDKLETLINSELEKYSFVNFANTVTRIQTLTNSELKKYSNQKSRIQNPNKHMTKSQTQIHYTYNLELMKKYSFVTKKPE